MTWSAVFLFMRFSDMIIGRANMCNKYLLLTAAILGSVVIAWAQAPALANPGTAAGSGGMSMWQALNQMSGTWAAGGLWSLNPYGRTNSTPGAVLNDTKRIGEGARLDLEATLQKLNQLPISSLRDRMLPDLALSQQGLMTKDFWQSYQLNEIHLEIPDLDPSHSTNSTMSELQKGIMQVSTQNDQLERRLNESQRQTSIGIGGHSTTVPSSHYDMNWNMGGGGSTSATSVYKSSSSAQGATVRAGGQGSGASHLLGNQSAAQGGGNQAVARTAATSARNGSASGSASRPFNSGKSGK
jgi:hypothetical protein